MAKGDYNYIYINYGPYSGENQGGESFVSAVAKSVSIGIYGGQLVGNLIRNTGLAHNVS